MPNENEIEKKSEKEVAEPKEPRKDKVDEFIDEARKLKQNSISKEEYDRVVAERDKMMKFVIDGEGKLPESKVEKVKVDDLKKIMRDPDVSNLAYVEASLKLRQAAIDEGKPDPYVSMHSNEPDSDKSRAEKIASILQECVDEAKGSDSMFRALLESRLGNDDPALIAAIKKRSKR